MGYPAKVHLIKYSKNVQWYVSFPAAVAKAMEFVISESVEWIIEDKGRLVLRRVETPASAIKNNFSPTLSTIRIPLTDDKTGFQPGRILL